MRDPLDAPPTAEDSPSGVPASAEPDPDGAYTTLVFEDGVFPPNCVNVQSYAPVNNFVAQSIFTNGRWQDIDLTVVEAREVAGSLIAAAASSALVPSEGES